MVAIVVSKSAKMPNSCWGHYRRVAILEVPYWLAAKYEARQWEPTMISERARGVYRVLWCSQPLNVGENIRSAHAKAWDGARERAAAYNAAGDLATAEQIIGAGGSA